MTAHEPYSDEECKRMKGELNDGHPDHIGSYYTLGTARRLFATIDRLREDRDKANRQLRNIATTIESDWKWTVGITVLGHVDELIQSNKDLTVERDQLRAMVGKLTPNFGKEHLLRDTAKMTADNADRIGRLEQRLNQIIELFQHVKKTHEES